jgi:hypothetical protein
MQRSLKYFETASDLGTELSTGCTDVIPLAVADNGGKVTI